MDVGWPGVLMKCAGGMLLDNLLNVTSLVA